MCLTFHFEIVSKGSTPVIIITKAAMLLAQVPEGSSPIQTLKTVSVDQYL